MADEKTAAPDAVVIGESRLTIADKRWRKGGEYVSKITVFDGANRWLSNYYPSPVIIDGFPFPHGEAAFQAQKYPREDWPRFNGLTPGQAKQLGRKARLPCGWNTEKSIEAMRRVVWSKFGENTLGLWLIGTEDAELIEGNNWHDNIWGNCTCGRCKNVEGKNQLGKLLMERREELKLLLPQIKKRVRQGRG